MLSWEYEDMVGGLVISDPYIQSLLLLTSAKYVSIMINYFCLLEESQLQVEHFLTGH